MPKPKRALRKLGRILLSAIGVLIVGYFVYHTIDGDRGWFAMLRMQREVDAAEKTLVQLQADRKALEHRTKLLRSDSLDPDLLDEKSRELLNYSKPNEIVILTPKDEEKEEK